MGHLFRFGTDGWEILSGISYENLIQLMLKNADVPPASIVPYMGYPLASHILLVPPLNQ